MIPASAQGDWVGLETPGDRCGGAMATILVCDGSPLIREQLRRAVGSVRMTTSVARRLARQGPEPLEGVDT